MDARQLPPEVIKLLLETGELDPEEAALAKQMETAEALRNRAIAPKSSDNVFGAIAQGLAGYGAGTMQKELAGKLKPFNERRIASRRGLFETMFPGPQQRAQQMPTLGRMTAPDPEEEYPTY